MSIVGNATSWLSGNAFDSGAGDVGSNLGPVKSGTVLSTARLRWDICLKEAVLPAAKLRGDGLANLWGETTLRWSRKLVTHFCV